MKAIAISIVNKCFSGFLLLPSFLDPHNYWIFYKTDTNQIFHKIGILKNLGKCIGKYLNSWILKLKFGLKSNQSNSKTNVSPLNANSTKWSNTLKQFVGKSRYSIVNNSIVNQCFSVSYCCFYFSILTITGKVCFCMSVRW